ncbi:hypothetical protein H1R20_g11724, partial [Candolleomyces eurysporus]
MSVDPYHAVQQEIQTSLQTASQLRSSYVRIRNMAKEDSEELMWARNELKATLAGLEADLEDLEESVKSQQAALMGEEIGVHNEMLDDLERNVDQTDSKVNDGMRRLRKFLRDSEEKGSGWCIVILMIVLMALLLAIILV